MSIFRDQQDFLIRHTQVLMDNYKRLLGEPLVTVTDDSPALTVWQAPFALVSHNTAAQPMFNYANLTALSLFEFDWDEFTALLSCLSAEPINQPEREALLASVREHGYIQDYQGVRLSKSGRRFQIKQAVVWNLYDQNDRYYGQAACFKEWLFL